MRTAFKEWAVIVDALERGDQIVILRKGGIHEGRGGFQPEHRSFWLFPTLFHQQRESVLPSAQQRFDLIAPSLSEAPLSPLGERAGVRGFEAREMDKVRIGSFAEVVDCRRIESLHAAESLKGQHVWIDEVIAQRFEWGREKNIFAIAVRVFRLAKPVEVPVLPIYGGCKSWIELEVPLKTDDAIRVLPEPGFTTRLNQFRAALDGVPVTH